MTKEEKKDTMYINGQLHKLIVERWKGYAGSEHMTMRWVPVENAVKKH